MLYSHNPRLRHPTLISSAQLHADLSPRLTILFFMFTLCSYSDLDTHITASAPGSMNVIQVLKVAATGPVRKKPSEVNIA